MSLKYRLLIIIAPLVFILDQLSKLAVLAWIPEGMRIPIIPGFFDLVHFRNLGAAFGLFSTMSASVRVPFFYAVAAVAAIALGFLYRSLPDRDRLLQVSLALIFGGIAGNILDRVRLGSVVDFLSFHLGDHVLDFSIGGWQVQTALEWPAFNIADSAITVAMILLIWSALFEKRTAR